MAVSPSHKFGQIIGDILELAIEPILKSFCEEYHLFLDKKGIRVGRSGKKVSWKDHNNNTHDLDFVLEKGGTEEKLGIPVAFIETAWRRYTKHSRNKAQEIQGAIIPLYQTYKHYSPFTGVVLGGVFTEGALTQLKSLGFNVLYFPYEMIIDAFKTVGADAFFDEDTSDKDFLKKIDLWQALKQEDKIKAYNKLIALNQKEVDVFIKSLQTTIERKIERIIVLALHGNTQAINSVDEAIKFIYDYNETSEQTLVRYEIEIRYSNGNKIKGEFSDKSTAITFLNQYKL